MDAARVESRPEPRAGYVVVESEAGGESAAVCEASNGWVRSWDRPNVGADDCRPNAGGSRFRTPEACWTPLSDILHASRVTDVDWRRPLRMRVGWLYALFRAGRPTGMSQVNWFRLQSTRGWRTPIRQHIPHSKSHTSRSCPRRTVQQRSWRQAESWSRGAIGS